MQTEAKTEDRGPRPGGPPTRGGSNSSGYSKLLLPDSQCTKEEGARKNTGQELGQRDRLMAQEVRSKAEESQGQRDKWEVPIPAWPAKNHLRALLYLVLLPCNVLGSRVWL